MKKVFLLGVIALEHCLVFASLRLLVVVSLWNYKYLSRREYEIIPEITPDCIFNFFSGTDLYIYDNDYHIFERHT